MFNVKLKSMVTIVGVTKKMSSKTNLEFNLLNLLGSPEVLLSRATGKPYLSARKATLACNMDEVMAKSLIGTTLPGEIQEQECKPFDLTLPTGKKIKVSRTFQYVTTE